MSGCDVCCDVMWVLMRDVMWVVSGCDVGCDVILQVILKELKGTREEDKTPPAWFTSYMEKVRALPRPATAHTSMLMH